MAQPYPSTLAMPASALCPRQTSCPLLPEGMLLVMARTELAASSGGILDLSEAMRFIIFLFLIWRR